MRVALLRGETCAYYEFFWGQDCPGVLESVIPPLSTTAARLTKELGKTEDELQKVGAKLGNENFVARAAPEIVEEMRERQRAFTERAEELRRMIASLQAA